MLCERPEGSAPAPKPTREGPAWQPSSEQRARWRSCWAACDRCGKWRLLLGIDAAELPSGEWWCGHSICPVRGSCQAPQELTEAQIDGEAIAESAAGLSLKRSTAPKCTHGYHGVYVTSWGAFQAKGRDGAVLGTFKTAVEAAVCVARYREEEEELHLELSSTLKTGYAGVMALTGGSFRATSQDGVCLGRQFATAADAAIARARHERELKTQFEAEEREEEQQSWQSCWVACDDCNKWRLLLGVRETDSSFSVTWSCKDSPDPSHNRCEVPEAVEADESDGLVTQAGGWKLPLAEDGSGYAGVHWRASRLSKQFEAVTEAGNSLGFFLTAVEAAIRVARFKEQQLQQDGSSLPAYGPLPPLRSKSKGVASPAASLAAAPCKRARPSVFGGKLSLAEYLEACGGTRDMVDGWSTKVEERKSIVSGSTRTSDTYFFSADGRRFRSRAEVARHFGLLEMAPQPARQPPARQPPARRPGGFDFKGKARAEVSGARITVWYEEEGQGGRTVDVPYVGIVMSCHPRVGLSVLFDHDQEMLITNEDEWAWGASAELMQEEEQEALHGYAYAYPEVPEASAAGAAGAAHEQELEECPSSALGTGVLRTEGLPPA